MRRNRRRCTRIAGLVVLAALAAACVAPSSPPGFIKTYAGLGFDACDSQGNTNAVAKLQAWINASPYRAVGLYIGGRSAFCPTSWSPSTVSAVRQMGWKILPIYVDLQAPCYGAPSIPSDFNGATAQGVAAAGGAISRMQALGMTGAVPIYLDVEGYNNTVPGCTQAVRWYVSAWAGALHQQGYLAGFYSSSASGIVDQVGIYNDPSYNQLDAIWFASWNGDPSLLEHHKEWLPDNVWTNHQRVHQYDGGTETWGGWTMGIDNDSLDAPVVG